MKQETIDKLKCDGCKFEKVKRKKQCYCCIRYERLTDNYKFENVEEWDEWEEIE